MKIIITIVNILMLKFKNTTAPFNYEESTGEIEEIPFFITFIVFSLLESSWQHVFKFSCKIDIFAKVIRLEI